MSGPRILVAGIGNIFFGDDAFGVEVVERLRRRQWPENITVRDFGIRGLDLAYTLLERWDRVVLVDALPRGEAPGTIYHLEVDDQCVSDAPALMEAHGFNPMRVLSLVKSLGGSIPPLEIVGCEPAELGSEEEPAMGLSQTVEAAVDEAMRLIESLLAEPVNAAVETVKVNPFAKE